jgi:hypothetical protein
MLNANGQEEEGVGGIERLSSVLHHLTPTSHITGRVAFFCAVNTSSAASSAWS